MKEINEESLLNISIPVTCCFMQKSLNINKFHGCYDRIYIPLFSALTSLLEGNTLWPSSITMTPVAPNDTGPFQMTRPWPGGWYPFLAWSHGKLEKIWARPFLAFLIGSMYGVFTYISHKKQLNVGKYTIHGSYGIWNTCSQIIFQRTGWFQSCSGLDSVNQ